MIVWTTPEFIFFTCPSPDNWEKVRLSLQCRRRGVSLSALSLTAAAQGRKAEKPKILQLSVKSEDQEKLSLVEQEGDEAGACG